MKRFEVLGVILLTGILLLGVSFYAPEFSMPGGESVSIRFMTTDEMLDFKIKANDERVDSIIQSLEKQAYGINEHRLILSNAMEGALFTQSPYLVNPDVSGGKALDNFFRALERCDSALVRVGHFGDSQIEGDRLTSLLRIFFQNQFKGNGVGFVPVDDITSPVSYARTASQNWKRNTVFKDRSEKGLYCLGGVSFHYKTGAISSKRDTLNGKDTVIYATNASLYLKIFRAYSHASIWYGAAQEPCHVQVFNSTNDQLIAEADLNKEDGFNVKRFEMKSVPTSLRFTFSGPSPEIYGLAFDPVTGVQFDNFGLRGHSGDGLLSVGRDFLHRQLDVLNMKLVILEFGGNVTPYVKNEGTLNYIEKAYNNLYRHFKEANPDGSVLVIGVNDVARQVGSGKFESYPMVSRIRDVQKKVALANGCAFFDLYELMGGESSVLAWSKKGLASHDGHYSDKGRELVGSAIFKALFGEYQRFKYHDKMMNL